MLEIDAPIRPGRGLGAIPIGTPIANILAEAKPLRVIELPGHGDEGGVTIHSFGAIRTWSVGGRVVQVGAFEGYTGRTAEGIGIGSSLAEVRTAYGDLVPSGAENMVELPGLPGAGIETTEWLTADEPDPDARIVQIFVSETDD